jgi:hypothetical protein
MLHAASSGAGEVEALLAVRGPFAVGVVVAGILAVVLAALGELGMSVVGGGGGVGGGVDVEVLEKLASRCTAERPKARSDLDGTTSPAPAEVGMVAADTADVVAVAAAVVVVAAAAGAVVADDADAVADDADAVADAAAQQQGPGLCTSQTLGFHRDVVQHSHHLFHLE